MISTQFLTRKFYNGNTKQGHEDVGGLSEHLSKIGQLLNSALEISEISSLEVDGPASEPSKLKEPLADLYPDFYVLEYGYP